MLQKGWLSSTESFYHNVCDGKECRAVIGNNIENFRLYGEAETKFVKRGAGYVTIEFPTNETKHRCLKHYLNMKKKEYDFIDDSSLAETISDLEKAIKEFQDVLGLEGVSYLINWRDILAS